MGHITEILNIESIEDPSTRELYKQRLNNKIKELILQELSVSEAWTAIKTKIIEAAKEALGTRKCRASKKKTNNTP